jgi:L-threonylcarbamoyladenylate synthase
VLRLELNRDTDLQGPIKRAGERLRDGGIVAYPTETVYGLAADTANESAIRRVFEVKRRKADQAILILIPSVDALNDYTDHVPPLATHLVKQFWPGDLTLIFKASGRVSPLLTGGSGKIGIRLSSHPVAAALAREMGRAITSTSANVSGIPPCRHPDEISDIFGDRVDLVLDAGPSGGGTPSTILDTTTDPPKILREGRIKRYQLIGSYMK